MNNATLSLAGANLVPLPSGALWWASEKLLAVSDLHLGRSERAARYGNGLLPPYETRDTLDRLALAVSQTQPRTILSLGDSFDDLEAAGAVQDEVIERLASLAAGRKWIWIAGNHDPGPVDLPGTHLSEHRSGRLIFRHIADPAHRPGDGGEVSGHYHPKARLWLRGSHIARPCFLSDAARVILPAFGTYTGGLEMTNPAFDELLDPESIAWLTGRQITRLPRRTGAAIAAPGARR